MIQACKLSMVWIVAATLLVASCVASPRPETSATKAQAGSPGIPVSRANLARLIGCWTYDGPQDSHATNLPEAIYGADRPLGTTTVCFGPRGRFVHSTFYQREGLRDVSAKYSLLREGHLGLSERDFIWGSDRIELHFTATNQLYMVIREAGANTKTAYLLQRDMADKDYLETTGDR